MFYNIHTKQIEDFTGNGLNDLRDGIARTPDDPHNTFMNSPVRILRTIRFATLEKLKWKEGKHNNK